MNKKLFKIKVLKWADYNPGRKKSYKKTLISNNFCTDNKLGVLPVTHRWMFLGILLTCGDHNRDTVVFNEKQLRVLLESSKSIVGALDALQSIQVLSYTVDEVAPYLNRSKEKRSKEKRIIHDHSDPGECVSVQQNLIEDSPQQKFDFEIIYANYPRKEGKSRGFTLLKKQIKSSEDFEKLSIAINNYRKRCEEKRVESRYIKHFATFANEWRDWVDENHGATESFATPTGRRSWA